jgi:hypothetical protein
MKFYGQGNVERGRALKRATWGIARVTAMKNVTVATGLRMSVTSNGQLVN